MGNLSAAFELVEVDSRSELLGMAPSLILGANVESPSRFYVIRLSESSFTAGVFCSFHGVRPAAVRVDESRLCVFSDDVLHLVDWRAETSTELKLNSIIYDVWLTGVEITVICELDAYAVVASGLEIAWHVSFNDVVEDYSMVDSRIVLTFPGDEIEIDSRTGLVSRR